MSLGPLKIYDTQCKTCRSPNRRDLEQVYDAGGSFYNVQQVAKSSYNETIGLSSIKRHFWHRQAKSYGPRKALSPVRILTKLKELEDRIETLEKRFSPYR